MIISLPGKAYFSDITVKNIYQSFTHKMAAKASWHWNYVTVLPYRNSELALLQRTRAWRIWFSSWPGRRTYRSEWSYRSTGRRDTRSRTPVSARSSCPSLTGSTTSFETRCSSRCVTAWSSRESRSILRTGPRKTLTVGHSESSVIKQLAKSDLVNGYIVNAVVIMPLQVYLLQRFTSTPCPPQTSTFYILNNSVKRTCLWLWQEGCTVVVCEAACCMEVRPSL